MNSLLSPPQTHNGSIVVRETAAARPKHLVGALGRQLHVFRPDQVDYIEAAGNHVKLHVGATEYTGRYTIAGLAQVLSGAFVRIRRSLLLNVLAIEYITRVGRCSYAFTLTSGLCLRSSRLYCAMILRTLPLRPLGNRSDKRE